MRKQMKIFSQIHHVTRLAVNAKFLKSCQNMLQLSIVEGKRDTPAHSLVGFRSHVNILSPEHTTQAEGLPKPEAEGVQGLC